MKEIIWYPHAQERLMERRISLKLVKAAIEKPDQIVHKGRRKIFHKLYWDQGTNKKYLLRIFIDEHARRS